MPIVWARERATNGRPYNCPGIRSPRLCLRRSHPPRKRGGLDAVGRALMQDLGLGLLGELLAVQVVVIAALAQQLLVLALLNDLAVLDHKD